MQSAERRYDLDWLRVIAIALLLIYHIAIGFQPWGVYIQFIQNSASWESLWIPMSALNIWRIPILFFVSGMGVCFAMRKRSIRQLVAERTKRILVPLLFGMVAIVPLHVWLWQKYYSLPLQYAPGPAHLWFLGNIFVYVIILLPLFVYIKRSTGEKLWHMLNKIFSSPLGILLVIALFVLEALVIKPDAFEVYYMSWHGFTLGLIAFTIGFLVSFEGSSFWKLVKKWKWLFLAAALILYLVRLTVFEMKSPMYLIAVESCVWIFALFGICYAYLNRPSKALAYLSKAAYPVYILHMLMLYAGSYLLFPLRVSPQLKYVLLVVFTISGCFLVYEYLIRRIPLLATLFGLKVASKAKEPQASLLRKTSLTTK